MTLYQKLFGLQLMAPVGDDGGDGGGGAPDRGDDFVPTEDDLDDAQGTAESDRSDEEAEKSNEEVVRPRSSDGKFAKREKVDDEVKIPKARFDSAVAKERARAEAAERRLAPRPDGQPSDRLESRPAARWEAPSRAAVPAHPTSAGFARRRGRSTGYPMGRRSSCTT